MQPHKTLELQLSASPQTEPPLSILTNPPNHNRIPHEVAVDHFIETCTKQKELHGIVPFTQQTKKM